MAEAIRDLRPPQSLDVCQLLGLDIDGTLLDPALFDPVGISFVVKKAVQAAEAAGIEIALITGRQSHSATAIARVLGLKRGWLSCSFGAVTVQFDPKIDGGHRIVRAETFSPHAVLSAIHHLEDVEYALEELGRGYLVNRYWPEGELVEPQILLGDREAPMTPSLMVRSTSLTLAELSGAVGAKGLSCTAFNLRGAAWINITPEGLSKLTGLQGIAETLGIRREGIVAAGDDRGDVEMLRWAGMGVAMGQSCSMVKEAADVVAGPVDKDGIVPIIEFLIAGRGTKGVPARAG
ncbi:MAG: HAD family phosphatase [Demequinaceae bacterium]|nr:HAD family phosphatase [Demequinaceae bacterium]